MPILWRMTYLTLRETTYIPLTGKSDNVLPDKIEAKISFEFWDGWKQPITEFPRKPLMITRES